MWVEPSVCGSVCPFLVYKCSSRLFSSWVDTPRRGNGERQHPRYYNGRSGGGEFDLIHIKRHSGIEEEWNMFRGGPFNNDRFLWMSAGTYVQGRLWYSSAFFPGIWVCFRPSPNVYWEIARSALLKTTAPSPSRSVSFCQFIIPPPQNVVGGGYTGFALSRRSVGRSIGPSVSNSCPLYNSFTNGRISLKLEWHIHLN